MCCVGMKEVFPEVPKSELSPRIRSAPEAAGEDLESMPKFRFTAMRERGCEIGNNPREAQRMIGNALPWCPHRDDRDCA